MKGKYTPFWFLDGDTYLYLGIGQRSHFWQFTFDGTYPTNGFHPLWQYIVTLAAGAASGDQLKYMNYVLWTSVACVSVAALLQAYAIFRFTRSMLLSVLVVPGIYYFVVGQSFNNMHIWNFVDGMESGLSMLLFGLVAVACAAFLTSEGTDDKIETSDTVPPLKMFAVLGAIFPFVILARLDEVFLLAAFAIATLVSNLQFRRKLVAVLYLGTPSAVVLLVYVTYNFYYAGSFMPTSGLAKGEGALLSNVYVTAVTFFAPVMDIREWFSGYVGDRQALSAASFRVAELLIPPLLCLGVLISMWPARKRPYYFVLFALCAGGILKALYNFVFVNFWHQSAWYFATECAAVNVAVAIALASTIKGLEKSKPALVSLTIAYLLFYSITVSKVYNNLLLGFGDRNLSFFKDRHAIETAVLSDDPNHKIVEFGDGLLNFALNIPTMHGFVFAGDKEALRALQSGTLLTLAFRRGFDVISSFNYMPWTSSEISSTAIRDFLEHSFIDARIKSELGNFDYKLIYVYEPTKSPFIKFFPKAAK